MKFQHFEVQAKQAGRNRTLPANASYFSTVFSLVSSDLLFPKLPPQMALFSFFLPRGFTPSSLIGLMLSMVLIFHLRSSLEAPEAEWDHCRERNRMASSLHSKSSLVVQETFRYLEPNTQICSRDLNVQEKKKNILIRQPPATGHQQGMKPNETSKSTSFYFPCWKLQHSFLLHGH